MSKPKQVIVVRKDLNMRKGKIAGQVGHAAMMFLTKQATIEEQKLTVTLSIPQHDWITNSFTKIVPYVNSEDELRSLIQKAKDSGVVVHECIDNGLTEFKGVPTLTCAAFGPDYPELLDPITGHLPLL